MEQVTSNIYTETKIRGCNPSIVFTSEGSVFVDTAQLLSKLLEMRKFALERGPIRYLINTEVHIDISLAINGLQARPSRSDTKSCATTCGRSRAQWTHTTTAWMYSSARIMRCSPRCRRAGNTL